VPHGGGLRPESAGAPHGAGRALALVRIALVRIALVRNGLVRNGLVRIEAQGVLNPQQDA
jgi:hypothetical protein